MKLCSIPLFFAVFVSIYACKPKTASHVEQTQEELIVDSRCYILSSQHEPVIIDGDTQLVLFDSTYLAIQILNDSINGVFEIRPAERDVALGTLSGSIQEGGDISAIYHYMQEGDEYDDAVEIRVTENAAKIRFVSSPVAVDEEADWIELAAVDCDGRLSWSDKQ